MSRSYSEQMRLISMITEPAVRQAISAMTLPPGSSGLDAGCGIGRQALWLAEEIGPEGEILGVDISADHLNCAENSTESAGLSSQVSYLQHDVHHIPFPSGSFDFVWCADVLWPVPGMNPRAVISEFRRVLKPSGRIGILFWTGQSLLPGYPLLEARLNLAHAQTNPYLRDVSRDQHFLCAGEWLRSAGFVHINKRSFLTEISAPLSDNISEAMGQCLDMLWGDLKEHVSASDWPLFQRLRDQSSEDCTFCHSEYHAMIIYTLFHARVPA